MSMLAEPKRKIKWTLNPRGHFWANDETKFGQKLLEKMGWQRGKGLGKLENGTTDNIKVVTRSDNSGVGWDNRTCNYTPGQADFSSLLNSLNQNYTANLPVIGTCSEVASDERVSLESKSKSSKKRVHYRKFVRGKDVSQYSEEDMECIFGKKISSALDISEKEDSLLGNNGSASEESTCQPTTAYANYHGVQTYTSSSSMADYFAQKWRNLNGKESNEKATSNGQHHKELIVPLHKDVSVETKETKSKRKKAKRKACLLEDTKLNEEPLEGIRKVKDIFSAKSAKRKRQRVDVVLSEDKRCASNVCSDSNNLKSCLKGNVFSNAAESKAVTFSDSVSCHLISPVKGTVKLCTKDGVVEPEPSLVNVSTLNDCELKAKKAVDISNVSCTVNGNHTVIEACTVERIESTPVVATSSSVFGPNEWSSSIKVAEKMSYYSAVIANIPKHEVLCTTNLVEIRGYGN